MQCVIEGLSAGFVDDQRSIDRLPWVSASAWLRLVIVELGRGLRARAVARVDEKSFTPELSLHHRREIEMTMPEERTLAVNQTHEFLVELSRDISLPEKVRRDAKFLLRHYPSKDDMARAARIEEYPASLTELVGPVFGPAS